MDILDILLAKKKSFTGETEKLTRQANEAMAKANEVANILQDAQDTNAAAQVALETAQAVKQEVQDTLDILEESAIDAVTEVNFVDNNNSTAKIKQANIRKDGTTTSYNITKNYTSTGNNEDGAMTQKAITAALTNQKNELENQIRNIPSSGNSGSGNVNGDFTDADPGSLVIVGENGNIVASNLTEEDIIKTQIVTGSYTAETAVGLEIDYNNKTYARVQEAKNLQAGSDFDQFIMYSGRKRCIVNDDGEIIAFYGEPSYIEDGSLGQVMVYQPKFYYTISVLESDKTSKREKINKEVMIISAQPQAGFSLHPLFLDKNNQPLEYVLLPAYDGCAYNTSNNTYLLYDEQIVDYTTDKLSSIAGVKPISGASQTFNVSAAEQMAQNRGEGWQLTNLAAESANQLLMTIEYGSLNLQTAFNKGIVNLNNYGSQNASCLTGSTSSLGSQSGMASSTTQTHGSTTEIFSGEGKCAISYRGFENPYGNIWRFIGGVKIIGDGSADGLTLQYTDNQNNIHSFASLFPDKSDWISHFGYDKNASWALVPTACINANSSLPIGDYIYVQPRLNGENCCVIGGKQSSGDYAGPFYIGSDFSYDTSLYSYSARIMHIPTAGSQIYLSNIEKWEAEVGGD